MSKGVQTDPKKDRRKMQNFLNNITKQIEDIIKNPKAKDRFRERLETYRQIREKYIKTLQQYQFDPDAWIKRWYGNPQYNDIIADVPKNPKKPDDLEGIICEYVVLSVIHDYPWENAQYPKLTEPDDKELACPIWDSVTGCRQFNLENGESLVDRTGRIIDALEHVRADLASLSTETVQNTAIAKKDEEKTKRDEASSTTQKPPKIFGDTITTPMVGLQINWRVCWDKLKNLPKAIRKFLSGRN